MCLGIEVGLKLFFICALEMGMGSLWKEGTKLLTHYNCCCWPLWKQGILHYSCYLGPLWKQVAYTSQLLLWARLKGEHLHITISF